LRVETARSKRSKIRLERLGRDADALIAHAQHRALAALLRRDHVV